jgi:hypothetical protein
LPEVVFTGAGFGFLGYYVAGTGRVGATVEVFRDAGCAGSLTESVTVAADGTFYASGLPAGVGVNSYWATQSFAGITSPCSTVPATISRTPRTPSGLETDPVSPANNNAPIVSGRTNTRDVSVDVYTNADCSGAPAATTTSISDRTFAVAVEVGDDTTTSFSAKASKDGLTSSCSDPVTYEALPNLPVVVFRDTSAPRTNDRGSVSGTGRAGATVRLYAGSSCTGALKASVTVDVVGTFLATVSFSAGVNLVSATQSLAGVTSPCSSEPATISVTPARPTGLKTDPVSPANNNEPVVSGRVDWNVFVSVYATPNCSGAPAATTTSASGRTFAVTVEVADYTTTSFSAKASKDGLTSACSYPITYEELSTLPAVLFTGAFVSPSGVGSVQGVGHAGATVGLFTNSRCSGSVVRSLPVDFAGMFSGTVPISAGVNSFWASQSVGSMTSVCSSNPATLLLTPRTPYSLETSPMSPANDNEPYVSGRVEQGVTVALYMNEDCSGVPARTFGNTSNESFGSRIDVGDDTITSFSATASKEGFTSNCSSPITYEEDSTAPDRPRLIRTFPASRGDDSTPLVIGTAEPGAHIVFRTNRFDSSANPYGVTGEGIAGPDGLFKIEVQVPEGINMWFVATATDAAGNGSVTSDALDYYATPGLSIENVETVLEGNRSARLTVSLSARSERLATVEWRTESGSAYSQVDYWLGAGTLTFQPGETSKTITVNIKADSIVEGNESFSVVLSNPTNAWIDRSTGTVVIIER